MKERRAARRLAIDVLYEAEIRDRLPLEALASRRDSGWVTTREDDELDVAAGMGSPSAEAQEYAAALIQGVQDHQADIDGLIARYADRWAISRMPVVDRTLVRIALFELLWRADIPTPVAINEAVELAKELSTEDSGRFINGLLGKVVEAEEAKS